MLDILAVQRLYGVATSGPLIGGGHTFGFNSNIEGYIGRFYNFNDDFNKKPVITLWTNGTNNTFDVSGFSDDATINLDPRHLLERRRPHEQRRHRLRHGDREGSRRQGQRHDHRVGRRLDPDGRRRQRQVVWRRGQRRADGRKRSGHVRSGRRPQYTARHPVEHEWRHRLQLRPEHHHRHRADGGRPHHLGVTFFGGDTTLSVGTSRSAFCSKASLPAATSWRWRAAGQQRAHDGDVRALPAQPVRGRPRRCRGDQRRRQRAVHDRRRHGALHDEAGRPPSRPSPTAWASTRSPPTARSSTPVSCFPTPTTFPLRRSISAARRQMPSASASS